MGMAHRYDPRYRERFAAALDEVRLLPKVDLHTHLSGCLRPQTVTELFGGPHPPVVLHRPAASYPLSFTPWFEVIDRVSRAPHLHERFVAEYGADMAADGVLYAEVRTSVRLPFDPLACREMIEAAGRGAATAREQHDIDVRLILGFNRQYLCHVEPDDQRKIVAQVLRIAAEQGNLVVGFDLWGDETGRPPALYQEVYATIADAGYPLAIHAGEAGNPEHIRQALVDLRCDRIGHGTSITQQWDLLDLARERGTPIEVCLTSNHLTTVVPDGCTHPAAWMRRAGLQVVLCADNTLVYGTTLSREYAHAYAGGLFTLAELRASALDAVDATFLRRGEKAALKARMSMEVATIR